MSDWEKYVKKLTPYVPGEQPRKKDVIKLNTNENPYPPAPGVQRILEDLDAGSLKKYPDPTVHDLRCALASYHGISEDRVFVGVGSDDVLAMSFITFFGDAKKSVAFADVTYSFYDVWCRLFGIEYERIPVREDFSIDLNAFDGDRGGIVIANPNAPSGIALSPGEIAGLISAHPECVVIVDEAYVDFGGESMLPYIDEFENLLVVRTFSKSRALAGSRIGYAMGSKKIISYLLAARDSFNSYTMDTITQRIGIASVEDDEYFKKRVSDIVKTREVYGKKLKDMGFSFPKSAANFLFATHEKMDAAGIYEELLNRGIYVRYFKTPGIDNRLRITIGTDDEMERLCIALKDILGI